jgi:bifunctional UDP-N-acetylglucosamine pyrophosphorylase/glucosamine-1-phosphate N-acetyltransferase
LSLTIIVLAAGQGVRMNSDLPKVMHPLEPDNLILVVGYRADLVRRTLDEGIVFVAQEEQLGTGHAVQQARIAAGQADTVLVLYGDTPLILPDTLHQVVRHHEDTRAAVTVLTSRPQDPTGYGRIIRDGSTDAVLAIVEERDATPEQKAIDEVSSGIFCFRDGWLWPSLEKIRKSPAGEYYLTDLVAIARAQGELVTAWTVSDPLEVIGLDQRVKLAQGEAEMRRRINQRWMAAGVTLVHPETTYIDADVEIGRDTTIWPNTYLQGQTHIGQGCAIGPGSVIRDSSIGDRCRVELSVVEQATMEEDSDIGPFGHLRKGAHLGKGAHMGNFGEVKNAYLGPGAKMGHVSYLGDAIVEAGANIGAGTITCNFDGERKHQTVIGAHAFVGSGTMLVAPVKIGEGATTGAGSVVTRDVPDGSVAFGVPARVRPTPDAEEPEAK